MKEKQVAYAVLEDPSFDEDITTVFAVYGDREDAETKRDAKPGYRRVEPVEVYL